MALGIQMLPDGWRVFGLPGGAGSLLIRGLLPPAGSIELRAFAGTSASGRGVARAVVYGARASFETERTLEARLHITEPTDSVTLVACDETGERLDPGSLGELSFEWAVAE